MTTAELTKKMESLMIICSEIYYQGRVAEKLAEQTSVECEPLPEMPPEPERGTSGTLWTIFLIFLVIALFQLFALGSFWFVASGFIGFVAFILAISEGDRINKEERRREYVKEQRKRIRKENEERKRKWERESPLQRWMLDSSAKEFRAAQSQCVKKLNIAWDSLNLPQKYQNHAMICSIYQYLYTGQCFTLAEAVSRLEIEMQSGRYFTDAVRAMKQAQSVKMNQPVWVDDLLKQEKSASGEANFLRVNYREQIREKNMPALSGNALAYALSGCIKEFCMTEDGYPYNTRHSVNNSINVVERAYWTFNQLTN